MRRTGSLVAAAALLAVSTPVWASVASAPAAQAARLRAATEDLKASGRIADLVISEADTALDVVVVLAAVPTAEN